MTLGDTDIASVRGMRAFRVNRDQSFLWLGEPHRGVLDALYGAVLSGSPLVILTGDVGAGKTMLAEAVAARLAETGVLVGRVVYPSRDPDDFWNAIVGAFGLPTDSAGRDAALAHFTDVVQRVGRTSRRALLVIDEAQVLTSEVLKEVGRACDAGPNVLTVLLVGEDELDLMLARPELADVAGRIGMRRRLAALGHREVALYIRHRLACAGAPPDVFTLDALRATAAFSRGIPRLINTLCARALVSGGGVDATLVERSARELACPGNDRRRRARPRSKLLGVTALLASAGVLVVAVSGGGEGRAPSRGTQSVAPAAAMMSGAASAHPASVAAGATPTPDVSSDPRPGRPAVSPIGAPPSSDGAQPRPTVSAIQRQDIHRATTTTIRAPKQSLSADRPVSRPSPPDSTARAADDSPSDPDPGAIIDWLLKDRSPAAAMTR